MKSYLKKFLIYILFSFNILEAAKKYYRLCIKCCNFTKNKNKILFQAAKNIRKIKFVCLNKKDYDFLTESILFKRICQKAKLSMAVEETFFYNPDFFILTLYRPARNLTTIGNITVNYEDVLSKGISGLKEDIKLFIQNNNEDKFYKAMLNICYGIEIYKERVKYFVNKMFPEKRELIDCLNQIPMLPARNFFEALQSILIINSLLWTNDYPLIGLGRLDQILYPFYKKDLERGTISKEKAKFLLKEFIKSLHKGLVYKSNTLPGDTGQVIVLSGKDKNNIDSANDLTILFLDLMRELKLPDPKIVLRVHANTPSEVWDKAMKLLFEGLGYPLFSNDDIMIPVLQQFGYDIKDTYNYVVSACWEPHIPGVSFDQNNVCNLNFVEPLIKLINRDLSKVITFSEFFELFKSELKEYVLLSLQKIEMIRFKPSPLLSLLTRCKEKDISEGGAKYNHLGILTVGLCNVVDSLLNLKRWKESKKIKSFDEIKEIVSNNFTNDPELLVDAKNRGLKFGNDEKEVIDLSNEIMNTVYNIIEDKITPFGGKYKVGYSSSSFVEAGKSLPATPDGRLEKYPLAVHISPSNGNITYLELFNFSSKLNYKKIFNGAVTDVIIERRILMKELSIFTELFKTFFILGGAQLQCNVLNYEQLVDAIKYPDKYPNLIVRVWGFSAYFKDLPEEYKLLIVERAKQYETFGY